MFFLALEQASPEKVKKMKLAGKWLIKARGALSS